MMLCLDYPCKFLHCACAPLFLSILQKQLLDYYPLPLTFSLNSSRAINGLERYRPVNMLSDYAYIACRSAHGNPLPRLVPPYGSSVFQRVDMVLLFE